MKKFNVAVLGATGAVGREMLKILEERKFPINTLKPLASARSAGKKLPFFDFVVWGGQRKSPEHF